MEVVCDQLRLVLREIRTHEYYHAGVVVLCVVPHISRTAFSTASFLYDPPINATSVFRTVSTNRRIFS